MNATDKIAIVIPAANESETIIEFAQQLLLESRKQRAQAELFFVLDHASKDDTLQKLQKFARRRPEIHVIFEPKNRNVVDAYVRGYKEALKSKCKWFIEMDCGFSHLPSELGLFIGGLRAGYDCVFGIRPLWSFQYQVPLKRRVLSLGGTIISNLCLGTQFSDMTSGYEAFTRAAITKILSKPLKSTGNFWHVEMRYRARKMRWTEVRITYQFPSASVRSKTVNDAFGVLWDLTQRRWSGKA
ncbi:MAG TPA: glycosyltransferase family 2 protein [Vitreimonas sp.]|nr:glycosyltransferase family 2 protein [Vitreimonas sp.]